MNRFLAKTGMAVMGMWGMILLTACSSAYRGPVSDHFDGSRFYGAAADHSFTDMMRWLWEMETVDWPAWVEDERQPVPPARVGRGHLKITYINHATLLIQTEELNILTDPIWSLRAGPFSWMGAKRVRAPGVDMVALPPIDYILISHNHYDHLDLPTLRQLVQRDRPTILVGLGVKSLLNGEGVRQVEELDWWQSAAIAEQRVSFTFVPAQHNSGRTVFGGNETLWGGFMIDTPQGQIYFAGDSGFGDFYSEISRRFRQIRLAILPVGSYEKRWFMKPMHMNPDDAVRIHRLLGAEKSVGMHFGTFVEHPEQSIDAHEKDLAVALATYRVNPEDFWLLKFGEGREVF